MARPPVNAHPHVSSGEIAVVHNGIIENYEALRDKLKALGYVFVTQTDTEVIAHLVHSHWHGAGGADLLRAVRAATAEFHGAYAIAVMTTREPGRIVGARAGSPLVVGIGKDDHYLASDAAALLSVTRRIVYLDEGDIAEIRRDSGMRSTTRAAHQVDRAVVHRRGIRRCGRAWPLSPLHAEGDLRAAARRRRHARRRRGHRSRSLRCERGADSRAGGQRADSRLRHQLLLGTCREAVDRIARRHPCQVEIASEYRYRDSVPNPNALVVVVSQSGETADTLAALKHAKSLGHTHTLAICNVATSSMVRQTALTYLTRAGTEIGVASTKAFTTQLVAHFLLALTLAKLRNRLTSEEEAHWLRGLRHLPAALQAVLALEPQLIAWAGALREEAARALPRPRPALPDRARRRAQAQGNLVHPRRGVPGRRAEARPAGARRCRDAGGRDRAQRRAARKAQVEPAGSARARRRALRRRRPRQPSRVERRHSRDPAAPARRAAVADPAHDSAAAPRVSHG